jgi:hypothetical protein
LKSAVFWDVALCGSEEHVASIFRLERARKLGTALAVTRRLLVICYC